DDFEIAGFSNSLLGNFSRRTEKIEDLARDRGINDPEEKAKLGALTRESKDKTLSKDDLVREWGERLTPAERKVLLDAVANRDHTPVEEMNAAAVDFAVRHVFERS